MVCLQLKVSGLLYVERSEKCHLYSVENHEEGTRAHPLFLSVTVSIMPYYAIVVWYVCNLRCGVWVGVT